MRRKKRTKKYVHRQQPLTPIERRDNHLARGGFWTYNDYLRSDFHKRIREYVMTRDEWQCKICGKEAKAVHHIEYNRDTLFGEPGSAAVNKKLKQVVALCHPCHKRAHYEADGTWSKRFGNRTHELIQNGGRIRRTGKGSVGEPGKPHSGRNQQRKAKKAKKPFDPTPRIRKPKPEPT